MIILYCVIALAAAALTSHESYYTWVTATVSIGGGVVVPDGPISDECENCGGDGILGDGTTKKTCPVCDGTGKKKTSDTPAAVDLNPEFFPTRILPPINPPRDRPTNQQILQTVRRADGTLYQRFVDPSVKKKSIPYAGTQSTTVQRDRLVSGRSAVYDRDRRPGDWWWGPESNLWDHCYRNHGLTDSTTIGWTTENLLDFHNSTHIAERGW